jgi:Flp pilus assembly protein TadD/predicted Ser/Thr protein kinase
VAEAADDETKHDRPPRATPRQVATAPDFGPRYRVIGQLGKGGMGDVYHAYDGELRADVALKIVRDEQDAALERFRREIALARKVTSPNVLRVYDLEEHEGLRFLSMEYVDGEDLGSLMRREKRLPSERVIAIARQVCAGLSAAHAQGVVHRDLKPNNVLIDKHGTVRVADFGLARVIGDSSLTASGAILGSPNYMSPEQITGDPTDQRSDIYSFGILLYQLLAGETPFQGDSAHAVMAMRLHKPPRPLRELAPDAPSWLAAVIAKCLARAPANRYQTVDEIAKALASSHAPPPARAWRRWLLVGGVAACAGLAIAVVAWPRGKAQDSPARQQAVAPTGATTPELTTLLLLGFENRAGDPVFDPTLDLVTEYALRRSTQIEPIATRACRSLASELGLQRVDEELGRRLQQRDGGRVFTLRGSIASNSPGFAISVTVADAATGHTVLERTVDAAALSDVMPAIGRLVTSTREALGDAVPASERDQVGVSPSLDANHEWALGTNLLAAGNLDEACAHLERAATEDPEFALARVAYSIALRNVRRFPESAAQYQRALTLVDRLSERDRLKFFGNYYTFVAEDSERAITAYSQLLKTWPKDQAAEANLAGAYMLHSEYDKMVAAGHRAAKDHPRLVSTRLNEATFEIVAGQYDRALSDLQRVLKDFARPPAETYEYLALASLFANRRADAVAAYAKYAELDRSEGAGALADFAIAEGRLGEAEQLLRPAIAADIAAKRLDEAEIKHEMLAELLLRRGDTAGARAEALYVTRAPLRILEAALVLLAAGDGKSALALADGLRKDVVPSRRAAAKLIEGESLRVQGKPDQAMTAMRDALGIADVPLGHFLLARAALDSRHLDDARAELDVCTQRRALVAFDISDVPSYRYVPLLIYYRAKLQDGLASADAKATYAAFLAMMHDPDPGDSLVVDARKHAR